MGFHTETFSFSITTDAHGGQKQDIDEALAAWFLASVEALAVSFNRVGRHPRTVVSLNWDPAEPPPARPARAIRTPEEIRDVPPDERTDDEIHRYGTHGPYVKPMPILHLLPSAEQ